MFKIFCFFLIGATIASSANAGFSQDTGRIVELFASASGAIAVRLDGGFVNGIAAGQCPGSVGGWDGHAAASNTLKAALMAAKATGSTIVITTEGCEGGWLKILDVYVK